MSNNIISVANTRDLALLSKAQKILVEARTIPDICNIENLAQRVREYAKKAGMGRDAVNAAALVVLDARRKAGETLKAMKERGELYDKGGDRKSKSQAAILKLSDLGLTLSQSSRYQTEASVPDDLYQDWVERVCKSNDGELHASGVRALARQISQPLENESQEPLSFILAAGKIRRTIENVWKSLTDDGKLSLPKFLIETASEYEPGIDGGDATAIGRQDIFEAFKTIMHEASEAQEALECKGHPYRAKVKHRVKNIFAAIQHAVGERVFKEFELLNAPAVTCPHCGRHTVDDYGCCAQCHKPGIVAMESNNEE